MSKVPPSLKETEYNAGAYLSLNEFLGHYGLTDNEIENMEGALVIRWKDWVNNANRTVETALYKYNDNVPILKTSESWTYAKSMALHWAQYEKAADEGAPNTTAKKDIFKMDKEQLIESLKAQPQQTTIRAVTSSNFSDDEVQLYSQTYGVGDLL